MQTSLTQKIIILSSIIFLTGCTNPVSQKTDFTSLYKANVSSNISEIRDIGEKLGYLGNYEISGTLHAMADVPTLFSGSLESTYEGLIHGYGLSQDSSITLKNPRFSYEMILSSGSLLADEASMISRGGNSYLRYSGLKGVGMYDDAVREILVKYEKSWLSITETDMLTSLSGSSESEKLAFELSQALSRMTLEDAERYLTAYPIWRETKSLGTVDGLATYEVELSKDNILAMANAFALKSTGKPLDTDAVMGLKADLESRNITGTIGYDVTNPKKARFHYTLPSNTGSTANLSIDTSDGLWHIVSDASGNTLDLSLTRGDNSYSLKGKIGDSTTALTLDATMKYDHDRFASLDATISASEQGMTLRVHHESAKDGTFLGSLDAGMGTLSWTGKIEEKSLRALSIKGAMVGSSLALSLVPGTGALLEGPLTIKNGDETVIEANVGLRVDQEHLYLSLDIPSPESPSVRTHALISLTGKKDKTVKTIEVPKDTKSFSELANEITKAMPFESISGNDNFTSSFTGTDVPLSLP